MRRPALKVIALFAVALALLPTSLVFAAAAPKYVKESYATFQSQLGSGQVRAVTFNKKAHSLHITLITGALMLASYPPEQYKTISAQIKAKGVPVAIEHTKKAGTTTTTTHHKLRYIAAGVLVVVIVVIALVLGFNRRRPPGEPAASAPAADAGPPPEPDAPAAGE
jgi:hypothetical protein